MHKETITYEDWNGVERTEDFYFHLTEQELIKMDVLENNSLQDKIKRIIDAKDQKEILNLFERIVYESYGVKSDDGKRFTKSKEVKDAFVENPAYSIIYMKLATDSEAAEKFVREIVPKPKNQPVQDVTSIANRNA